MKHFVSIIIFVSMIAARPAQANICGAHTMFGFPSNVDQFICNDGFAVGYSYQHKQPIIVAFQISDHSVNGVNVERSDTRDGGYIGFHEDQRIPSTARATLNDYIRSGYDRGHLAGSAFIDYSREANDETFALSNISPQLAGFNRNMSGHKGAWGFAEDKLRAWVKSRPELIVYVGSAFLEPMGSIGSGVTVPSHFYMIIVDYKSRSQETISFLLPHVENKRDDLAQYITSIDSIEVLTGLNFLTRLKPLDQDRIESKMAAKLWPASRLSTSNILDTPIAPNSKLVGFDGDLTVRGVVDGLKNVFKNMTEE